MHRVLVLGSGFMSGPLVEYLVRDGTVAVTVASNILEQAQQLAKTYQNTTAASVDVSCDTNLKTLISDHELVISYVPNSLHPVIAKQCLDRKVNMVTASYVSPEMKALHQPAIEADITILNEVGVDPGIDHMLAMECFDEVLSKGGKVVSFESWCGGLPHPDNADNALKYKFSWSPRTVLLAALRTAKFIRDGRLNEVVEGHLMEPSNVLPFNNILPGVEMEGYYNTDSVKYVDIYSIPDAKTVVRGTLRYKGYCRVVQGMYKLGLLSLVENQRLTQGAAELRWKDLMGILISQGDVRQPDLQSSVFHAVGKDHEVVKALEDLRLLSDDPVDLAGTPLDALCSHLQKHLQFKPGETDAIFLHHFIGIEWPDKKQEVRHIDFTMYGEPNGFSAMAKTVGTPTAIAAKMILNGEVKTRGVLTPTTMDIYKPILERLREEGIGANTKQL